MRIGSPHNRGRRWAAFGILVGLTAGAAAALAYPRIANPAWGLGERLTFAVKYGPIRAGTSVLEVADETDWNGRPALKLKATTVSADWFFYRVRDSIVSYVDREGLFAWQYEKNQREGNYQNRESTSFNHETRRAVRYDDGQRHELADVPRYVKDVLGALYYVRTQPLATGDVLKLPVHDGRRCYELEVAVLQRERVRVPAGEFDCLVIEPKLQSEGIFVRKGRILVWLTDDRRHLPVRMKTAIPIGSIVANLESMAGVRPGS